MRLRVSLPLSADLRGLIGVFRYVVMLVRPTGPGTLKTKPGQQDLGTHLRAFLVLIANKVVTKYRAVFFKRSFTLPAFFDADTYLRKVIVNDIVNHIKQLIKKLNLGWHTPSHDHKYK